TLRHRRARLWRSDTGLRTRLPDSARIRSAAHRQHRARGREGCDGERCRDASDRRFRCVPAEAPGVRLPLGHADGAGVRGGATLTAAHRLCRGRGRAGAARRAGGGRRAARHSGADRAARDRPRAPRQARLETRAWARLRDRQHPRRSASPRIRARILSADAAPRRHARPGDGGDAQSPYADRGDARAPRRRRRDAVRHQRQLPRPPALHPRRDRDARRRAHAGGDADGADAEAAALHLRHARQPRPGRRRDRRNDAARRRAGAAIRTRAVGRAAVALELRQLGRPVGAEDARGARPRPRENARPRRGEHHLQHAARDRGRRHRDRGLPARRGASGARADAVVDGAAHPQHDRGRCGRGECARLGRSARVAAGVFRPLMRAAGERLHRIVVVGGGAGGLELATRLGDTLGRQRLAEVTLVERARTHFWKPHLHEIAAGSMDLDVYETDYLAQSHWHSFGYRIGQMTGLDRGARTVQVAPFIDEDGREVAPAHEIPWDTLVIAIGSRTNDFGTPGAAVHAIALDDAEAAQRFHRRLVNACLRAQAQSGPLAAGQLRVAIIGAGATGVELAAELHNTTRTLVSYGLDRIDPDPDIRLIVVEAAPRILPALPERLSRAAARLLERMKIAVHTGSRVAEVLPGGVRLASGEFIDAELVVWAAGVNAP